MNDTQTHWRQISPPDWAIEAAVEIQQHIEEFVASAPMSQRQFAVAKMPAREIAQLITLHVRNSRMKHARTERVELTPEGWWVAAKARPCLLSLGRQRFLQLFPLALSAYANDMQLNELMNEFNCRLTTEQAEAMRDVAAEAHKLAKGT